MNKMKKALLLALSIAMSATLFAACGKKGGNNGGASSSDGSSSEVSTPVEDESSEDEASSDESSTEPEVETYTFTKIDGNPRMPGSTVITAELEAGAALDLTAPDPVDGKVFNGWIYADGSAVEEGAVMPEEALAIYADWTITPYTVTIKQAGQEDKVLTFGVEQDIDEEIIGINEIAWMVEQEVPADEGETTYELQGMPETWELQNYEVTIVATTKTYTFTKINGNPRQPGAVTMVELEAGAALDLTAPDPVDGKVFNGWVDGNGEAVELTVMPSEPVTVYADWTITPYTVTLKQDGKEDKVFTFGVEEDYNDLENPIIGIEQIAWVLEGEIPADTKTTKYTVTGMPEVWALQDYEIVITAEIVDDEDLAGTIKHWDRINKNILEANGNVKTNVNNYWDGSASSAKTVNQKEVTNGSTFANKLSFNVNDLTKEEYDACMADNDSWWKGEMWVGFALPVGGIDLTNYELTFDMKLENTNPNSVIIYAAKDYEGEQENVAFETGAHTTYKQSDMEELGDGWYRWTITVDCEAAAGKAADYIVFSLDNTAADVNKENDSVAYIDNMELTEIFYYTATIDGVEQDDKVRGGSEYMPETPSKDGYEFLGWVDADGNEVTTPILVEGDITLVSTWKKLPIQIDEFVVTAIDLGDSDYEIVSFTGKAGTYNITMGGGIKAVSFDGETIGSEITQIVLTEDGERCDFAISFSYDDYEIYTTGTIFITGEHDELRPYLWRDDKHALTVNSTMPAPVGFSKVAEFNWGNNATLDGNGMPWSQNVKDFPSHIISTQDISNYDDLWFAMKLIEGTGFFARGAENDKYMGTDWLYVHYTKAEDGTWTLTMQSADGSYYKPNLQKGIVASTLKGLMEYNTNSCLYPTRNVDNHNTMFYMTEVLTDIPPAPPTPPYDPEISVDAVKIGDSMFSTASNQWLQIEVNGDVGSVTAPDGFSSVIRHDAKTEEAMVWTKSVLQGQNYFNTALTDYSEVWFAAKLEGARWVFMGSGKADVTTSWAYFHLTQTGEDENGNTLWKIEVTIDGEVYVTIENQSGAFIDNNRKADTLSRLLYDDGYSSADGNAIMIYHNEGGSASLYATEIVGVEKEAEPFNPNISENAEKVWDHIWSPYYFTGGGAAEGKYSDMAAPVGFTTTSEYTWTGRDFAYKYNHFNAGDISKYSDIYFAMKTDENGRIYLQGAPDNGGISGEWVYVHMYQAADGTWSKDFYTASGYVATGVQTGLTATTLPALVSYGSGFNQGSYPNAADGVTATAYFTEVLGVVKPYDPEISVDAVKIGDSMFSTASNQWLQIEVNGDVGGVTAPDGFSSVIRHDAKTEEAMIWTKSNLQAQNYFNTDLTDYSEVWFAAKLEGARWVFNGLGKSDVYTPWVYFHLTQTGEDENGNTLWKIEVTIDGEVYVTIENQSGSLIDSNRKANTIARLLYDDGYGSADGNAIMTYHNEGGSASLYATEVVGVRKPFDPAIPENATVAMEHFWRESDAYPCTNVSASVEAPKGFTSVYKDDWNSHHASITAQYTYTMNSTFDITQYSDLYFAMKLENGTHIYVRANGSEHYKGTDWLYVHYHQNDDGTWTLTVKSADGYSVVSQQTYTATNMKALIENNLYGHRTDTTLNTCTYFTEVLGIAKVVEEA